LFGEVIKEKIVMMQKYYKDLWIQALRSGKYKQGRGYLKYILDKEGFYCCLGVLEEIVRNDPSNSLEKDFNSGRAFCSVEVTNEVFARHAGITSPYDLEFPYDSEISFEIKLTKDHPILKMENFENFDINQRIHLSSLNDKGIQFEVIANLIEEQL